MNELLLDVDDPLITVIYGAKSECGASKLQAREFIQSRKNNMHGNTLVLAIHQRERVTMFTFTLGSRIEFDPQWNDSTIPKNSGNELDPRVPLEPSFRPWGPRTQYTGFSKNSWVTIRTLLCFEIQQNRYHFYSTNFLFFYNKSALRFAVTQSIAKLGFYSGPAVF